MFFFSLQIEKPTELSRRERSVGFVIILFLIVCIPSKSDFIVIYEKGNELKS